MTLPNDPVRCQYCGNFHQTICPTIKAMEYHPNGTIKRVEFKTANDWRDRRISSALRGKRIEMTDRDFIQIAMKHFIVPDHRMLQCFREIVEYSNGDTRPTQGIANSANAAAQLSDARYAQGYQDGWEEPCPNCGHIKGSEHDNDESEPK